MLDFTIVLVSKRALPSDFTSGKISQISTRTYVHRSNESINFRNVVIEENLCLPVRRCAFGAYRHGPVWNCRKTREIFPTVNGRNRNKVSFEQTTAQTNRRRVQAACFVVYKNIRFARVLHVLT